MTTAVAAAAATWGTRCEPVIAKVTPVTTPPIACVVTELTLLKSVVVATQMPTLHAAGIGLGMVTPVRVLV